MADDANPSAELAQRRAERARQIGLATRELRDITDDEIDAFCKPDLTHLCNCWGVKYNANSSVHTLRGKFRQFRDEWIALEEEIPSPDITPPSSPTPTAEEATTAPNPSSSPHSMGDRTFDEAWSDAAAAADAAAAKADNPTVSVLFHSIVDRLNQ